MPIVCMVPALHRPHARLLAAEQIPRFRVDQLSVKQFQEQFAKPRRAVVLTHGDQATGDERWSFDFVKRAVGEKTVCPKRHNAASVSWARLEVCVLQLCTATCCSCVQHAAVVCCSIF